MLHRNCTCFYVWLKLQYPKLCKCEFNSTSTSSCSALKFVRVNSMHNFRGGLNPNHNKTHEKSMLLTLITTQNARDIVHQAAKEALRAQFHKVHFERKGPSGVPFNASTLIHCPTLLISEQY